MKTLFSPQSTSANSPKPALMPNLNQRCYEPELMDAENLDRDTLWQTLRELEIINRWLGGYSTILNGLEQLIAGAGPKREWTLVDVGCGGGDTLRVIADWAQQKGYHIQLTGIDMQPECLEYAKAHAPDHQIHWIDSDFREVIGPFDIITSSQFCHHLDDALLRDFFSWTRREGRVGYVINDLQRHPLAYQGIHILTALYSRSELVRYDAPMSVRRGFSRQDLLVAAKSAGLHPQIQWQWAFRYLVMGYV